MAGLTPEEKAAKAAQEAEVAEQRRIAEAEAQRLADAKVAQEVETRRLVESEVARQLSAQTPAATTVDPGGADPVAAVAIAEPPKTATCAGCKTVWPVGRLGAGVTIPCTCGHLVTVE